MSNVKTVTCSWVLCYGLASLPGGVVILLVSSCWVPCEGLASHPGRGWGIRIFCISLTTITYVECRVVDSFDPHEWIILCTVRKMDLSIRKLYSLTTVLRNCTLREKQNKKKKQKKTTTTTTKKQRICLLLVLEACFHGR